MLAGAYALDAIDGPDRARLERHLARCPACAAELRELREATARLAGAVAAERLTVLGLASAERQRTGRRVRTVYSITPAGRRAPREWLREPGTGPVLEFTAAIKLFYADQGSKQDALATLAAVTDWAERMRAVGAAIGREYLDTDGGPFPGRLHINTLINEFLLRHSDMISDWADWAAAQVRDWNGTGPQPHRHHADLESYGRGAGS
jgi:PadR family transcriptional regulator AphA